MYRFKIFWIIFKEFYKMSKQLKAIKKQEKKDIDYLEKIKPYFHRGTKNIQ